MHHANIAMLRALGNRLVKQARTSIGKIGAAEDPIVALSIGQTTAVLQSIAEACLLAADDLAAQDAALRAPFEAQVGAG